MGSLGNRVMKELSKIVGKDYIQLDVENEINDNSLGIKRKIKGIIYPKNVNEVKGIVNLANKHKIHLYPFSIGKNIGYGEKLPTSDNCLLVDLSRMNRILEFDNVHGFVRVEPGITQGQLYEFLKKNKSRFWMDVTGAGLDASIIGNVLEGGFGHSPKGNKRKMSSDFEVVLGNGNVIRTGTFPSLGPDLTGLFIQSNFGIITSLRIELMPIPEQFKSFVIKIDKDSDLEKVINRLRILRQKGIINSLVHIANPVRTLVTTYKFLKGMKKDEIIDSHKAIRFLNSPLVKIGWWNALGGLYGTKREIIVKEKEMRRAFNGVGKITFFSDKKIGFLDNLLGNYLLRNIRTIKKTRRNLKSLKDLHGLLKGVPNNEAMKNILWKVDNIHDLGLIWFSPVVSSSGSQTREIINFGNELYTKYKFEMPLTITLLEHNILVFVFSITFNKNIDEEKNRAYKLYKELASKCASLGVFPYRNSILSMNEDFYDKERLKALKEIKKALDPNSIISPGRYGI